MSPWLSDLLLRTQTDERLVALAVLGNQRACETIADRYRQPLLGFARRLNPDRAEDLVQQTFLSALSALGAGTEVRHLRGWLYEILRNLAWRDAAGSPVLAELDETAPLTESSQQVAERRMLALDTLTALAQLPERQHDALLQTAIHGRSRTEVAAMMGLSEGAVRQLVHRGRAALRATVTAITPLPLVRWLCGARADTALGLPEATLGAGAASGVGMALKVGVGAVLASGVVAAGVISGVPLHSGAGRDASQPAATRREASVATPPRGDSQAAASSATAAGLRLAGSHTGGRPGKLQSAAGSGGRSVGGDGLARSGAGPGPSASRGSDSGHGSGEHSSGGGPGPGGSGGGPGRGSGDGRGSSGSGDGNGASSGSSGGGGGSGDGISTGSGDGISAGSISGGSDGSGSGGSDGSGGGGGNGSGDGSHGSQGGSGSGSGATISGSDGGGNGSGQPIGTGSTSGHGAGSGDGGTGDGGSSGG